MNELRKYATFSIDLMGEPMKVNSMFSIGRARIFYKGPNRNRSIIEGETADKLAATIPGTPIIGLYNYDTEDFEGHGDGEAAYGFVPLNPNPAWVKIDDDGKEREYLEVDVVVWDGRFEEAKSILTDEKSLSMELNPATLKGTIVELGGHSYYNIQNAEFAGITVLGEEVEPCFKDAGFLMAYSNMVSAYANYMANIQENEEGGISQMENIDEVKVEEVVEPEVKAEVEAEAEIVAEVETNATAEETVEEVKETNEVETTEEVVEAEEVEETVAEEAPAEEFAAEDKKEEEKCPECGENPCVCKNACGNKKDEYSLIETELAELKAKYESVQNELNAALEALKEYTRQEKLNIIAKFSAKLEDSEELVNDLTDRVDDLSKEEIKAELGSALIDQIAAEEENNTAEETSNFSLNMTVENNIGNSAWDLVKRYKESK